MTLNHLEDIMLCYTMTHITLTWMALIPSRAVEMCGYYLEFHLAQIYKPSAIVCLLKFTLCFL